MAATAEADAILLSMREPSPRDGAPPPGSVPARPELDLNKPAQDDEGGGGGAADRSRRDGERADGSAPAARDGAAATPLPERAVKCSATVERESPAWKPKGNDLDLNQPAGDDEGGGGAADGSRRGGESAAEGTAHGDAARKTKSLPEGAVACCDCGACFTDGSQSLAEDQGKAMPPVPDRLAEGTCGAAEEEFYEFDLKSLWGSLPAGLGFHPTEQELLEHLLAKLDDGINSHPLIDDCITTIQDEDGICHTHLENLSGVTKDGNAKYFFHRPSNAYTIGKKKRRKIQGELTWHQTGKCCPVIGDDGRVMGYKKFMVLYNRKQRRLESNKWVMHQFHIGEQSDEEGELVVSKIFYQTKHP